MKKNSAALILRWAVVLVTILGGARLLIALSHRGMGHLPTNVLRVICVAEIAGGIFLLIPRTLKFGGICLLAVFAAAAAVHVLHREYDISNLILLAAAVAVVLPTERGRTIQ